MPFNNTIDRTGATALMPEDASREIIQGAPTSSAILQLARRMPDMPRAQRRMPVLDALITSYFVNADTGLKQTDELLWSNKFLDAEEMAVIVPIPETVLDDNDYDIWGEVRPRIVEAFGKLFDAAVIHGTNAPTAWPDDLVTSATAAGNVVTLGTGNDLYDDLLGEGGVLSKVEEDGYMVRGHVAAITMRAKLRSLRDASGQPIFNRSMTDGTPYELDGESIFFVNNGALDPTLALQVSGDFQNLVYALRQDITYKILDQAVIQDAAGNIVWNLAQQDMVALRAVMRIAWQVPNPINTVEPTEANRFPFAVLLP